MNTVEQTILLNKVAAKKDWEHLCLQVSPFCYIPVQRLLSVKDGDGTRMLCYVFTDEEKLEVTGMPLSSIDAEDFKFVTVTDVFEQVTH